MDNQAVDNQEQNNELPENYEELKKSANRMSNWRERLSAIEELGKWKSKKVIDVLTSRAKNDPVYTVQVAAVRILKQFGEVIDNPVNSNTELVKGIYKILLRVKKSLPKTHTYEEFKEKLKKMRLDVYDTYEGDKGAEFDSWLEEKWKELN